MCLLVNKVHAVQHYNSSTFSHLHYAQLISSPSLIDKENNNSDSHVGTFQYQVLCIYVFPRLRRAQCVTHSLRRSVTSIFTQFSQVEKESKHVVNMQLESDQL